MSNDMAAKQNQSKLLLDENNGSNALLDVEEVLAHMSSTSPPVIELIETLPDEKFLLSSNLQKSIRRGRVDMAQASAIALHRIDSAYFWRRLPIIALEDVGIGSVQICFDVVRYCGSRLLRQSFDESQLAAYLAFHLASSAKSRAACELLFLVGKNLAFQSTKRGLAQKTNDELSELAVDSNQPLLERSIALLLLDKLHLRSESGRQECLTRVAAAFHLPDILTYTLLNGKSTTGLSALIPLVFEKTYKTPTSIERTTTDEVLINGLLSCSLDQYTRLGKRAIYSFLNQDKELREFLFTHTDPRCSTLGLFSMLLFQIEGCATDKRLGSTWLNELKYECESTEIQLLGMPDIEKITELSQLMISKLPLLNEVRLEVMRKGGF